MNNNFEPLRPIRHELRTGVLRISFDGETDQLAMSATYENCDGTWFQTIYDERKMIGILPMLRGRTDGIAALIREKPIDVTVGYNDATITFQPTFADGMSLTFALVLKRITEDVKEEFVEDRTIANLRDQLAHAERELVKARLKRDPATYSQRDLYNIAMNLQFDKVKQLLDAGIPAIRFISDYKHAIIALLDNASIFMPKAVDMACLLLKHMPHRHGPSFENKPFRTYLAKKMTTASTKVKIELAKVYQILDGDRKRSGWRVTFCRSASPPRRHRSSARTARRF